MPDLPSQNGQTAMIGIGEYRVGSFPMMTIGLGSCIGLTLFDEAAGVGAMVHIMLPDSAGRTDRPGKYA
ncbi:MAG: chemotaxis protein CheD, partial [Methanoregula sp.]|nr:chemotaxis protein CheD [Methanoregula sp.]